MSQANSTNTEEKGFNLSAWALANQQLVAFFLLVVMVCGVYSYDRLPRNEDPAFTIKTAVVSAGWPGATVLDTMNLVTEPIEKKLQEIPYLDFVESYTKSGESVVFIALKDNTPPEMVPDIWYKVRKKMQDLTPSLPVGVSPPSVNDEFDDTYGTIYGFVADGFTPRELRDYVEDMRSALLQVPNVGKIDILGVEEEQIVVEFSPRRMAGLGLDPAQVLQSIQAQNAVTPTGVVRTDAERISLRVSGAFTSEQSIRDITLRLGDRFVALSEIATVSRQLAEPAAPQFKVNGDKALGLAISMAATGNMLEFGQGISAKMTELASTLPHGIELHVVADQSAVVKDAVGGFLKVLIEAVIIVLAVSFVSLGTRAGLVVAVSVPVVLAMTFVGMDLAGIGLQRISLGALIIALGLLVDDAMITVEAMVSRLEAGWDLRRSASYAYETTAFPMLTGTLVMIAGFIPVGFASSSAGEYCFSLFMVVLIALMSSWIVAVLFSPLLGVWLLKATPGAGHPAPGKFMQAYDRVLVMALRHRGRSIALALGLFVLALFGSNQLEEEFFPASDRPELLISINLPQNSAQDETARRTAMLEQVLKADADVAYFSSYIGSGAIRFYLPMDVLLSHENVAQIVVVTKGLAERDAVRQRLDALVQKDFSDLVVRVSPLELGPPVGWPLKYRVMGPDIDVVRAQALTLSSIIGDNSNTRDVNMTAGEPERSVLVEVNQTEARAAGFSSEDVASALATIFSGQTLTSVRDGKRLVNVVVRGQRSEREDLATVANLQIRTADGRAVPLRQIATVSYGLADPMVWRRQRQAFITVQADIAPGMTAQAVVNSLQADVAQFTAKLPQGYQLEIGGAAAESEKGNASVFAVLPVTMLVMLVLLMIQLKRVSRTLLAFITAPFGLIGIVLAMLPSGTPLGFVALLGVIALAGMIIRNAVILISEVDTNVDNGMDRDEAIMAATRHRARPILLTAAAAILGMIPIATQVFWGPMAYAIIGGLFAATLLTLTVLPCALSLLMQREMKTSSPVIIAQGSTVL